MSDEGEKIATAWIFGLTILYSVITALIIDCWVMRSRYPTYRSGDRATLLITD